jgi:hypothetical protein
VHYGRRVIAAEADVRTRLRLADTPGRRRQSWVADRQARNGATAIAGREWERRYERVDETLAGMDATEIKAAFDDVHDQAIVFHGFADYMRDYDIYIHTRAVLSTGIQLQLHLRYRFKHCVRAEVTTAVPPDVWKRSLDERLTDSAQGRDLDGYVWGVAWQEIYPGFTLKGDSPAAQFWFKELGFPFYEATVGANGHNLTLVFADLVVETLKSGVTPFVVHDGAPDDVNNPLLPDDVNNPL